MAETNAIREVLKRLSDVQQEDQPPSYAIVPVPRQAPRPVPTPSRPPRPSCSSGFSSQSMSMESLEPDDDDDYVSFSSQIDSLMSPEPRRPSVQDNYTQMSCVCVCVRVGCLVLRVWYCDAIVDAKLTIPRAGRLVAMNDIRDANSGSVVSA